MTKLQETFIKNLRSYRKMAGLTQEMASERIGITHSYYGTLELGGKFPSVKTIEQIAKALGIAAYRLFIDSPQVETMPSTELLDQYNDFLIERYRKDLVSAKTEFLQVLEIKSRSR